MEKFLVRNEGQRCLIRAIVQGIIGGFIANIDLVVGWCVLDPSIRALVVALVMAVLLPVMAALGGNDNTLQIPRGEALGA